MGNTDMIRIIAEITIEFGVIRTFNTFTHNTLLDIYCK